MFAFPSFLVKMDRGGAQAPEWGPGRLGQPLGRLLARAASGGRLRPRRRPRPHSGIPPVAGAAPRVEAAAAPERERRRQM